MTKTKGKKSEAAKFRRCATCGKKTPHRQITRSIRNPARQIPSIEWGKAYKRTVDCCLVCKAESTPFGIHCRVCDGTQFRVKYTRHKAPGLTVRVKECKQCGEPMRTSERPAKG